MAKKFFVAEVTFKYFFPTGTRNLQHNRFVPEKLEDLHILHLLDFQRHAISLLQGH